MASRHLCQGFAAHLRSRLLVLLLRVRERMRAFGRAGVCARVYAVVG